MCINISQKSDKHFIITLDNKVLKEIKHQGKIKTDYRIIKVSETYRNDKTRKYEDIFPSSHSPTYNQQCLNLMYNLNKNRLFKYIKGNHPIASILKVELDFMVSTHCFYGVSYCKPDSKYIKSEALNKAILNVNKKIRKSNLLDSDLLYYLNFNIFNTYNKQQ